MSHRCFAAVRRYCSVLASAVVCALVVLPCASSYGQNNIDNTLGRVSAVGGVSIDAAGILKNATRDTLNQLSRLRSEAMQNIPGDLNAAVPMREVSLRRLEAAIDECTKNNKPLPDAIKYLAGLQQVRYVFVYPEQKDIVLVGPAEGWKVDATGTIVGVTTGRPVMQLNDLLVALRSAKNAAQGGISCSIDPTPEGIARVNELKVHPGISPASVAKAREKAMGMQQITLHGVPETSHFARILVAADYRMKRISMALDPSPVRGLPSYLSMLNGNAPISPRFWLEPKFDAVLCGADGLAFELCGSSVKAMTEDDFLANGGIQHSGKASPIAQKWASAMTEKYPELAVADPVFGELQNCMELAVVAAIIVKNDLPQKAGYDLPTLLNSPDLQPNVFNVPKQVPTVASVKGRLVAVSGGVTINSWAYAEKAKTSDKVASVRTKAVFQKNAAWWQN
jgi:hypothetical protein